MQVFSIFQALCLLTLANGTPVMVKKLLGRKWAYPLDVGVNLPDGRPLFGNSKTIRGVIFSLAVTAGLAPFLGSSVQVGSLVAAFAMIGDLFSSFVKRRLGFQPSSRATGLDQIPESLFPLLVCQRELSLTFTDVGIVVGLFFVGELMVSRFLYFLRIRDQPY
ncbi:MAG TPA: CDP-archaeol synthase [Bradyrhizobium sp.]|nr:CDP-archaeol synthase [Bradyrhizobium sp.]